MKVIKKYPQGRKQVTNSWDSVTRIIDDFIKSSAIAIYIAIDIPIYIKKYKEGLLSKVLGKWSFQMCFIPNYKAITDDKIRLDTVIEYDGFFYINNNIDSYICRYEDAIIFENKQDFYKALENYARR